MTINPEHRSLLKLILLIVAIVFFAVAWYISLGNDIFDSTNAGAFGYAGLAFGFASFLP